MGSEYRRPLEGISSSIDHLRDPIEEVPEKISKSVDDLGNTISYSAAIQSVDLLTEYEISELRKLVELGPQARGYAEDAMADKSKLGMYAQLSDLGFIHCFRYDDGKLMFVGTDLKASWAIARYDNLNEAEHLKNEEMKRQRRNDRIFSISMLVLGWVLGLISSIAFAH